MKIKSFLSFVIFIILLSSCSKTPGKTGAKIKLSLGSMIELSSVARGGAMLWGRSNKGDMFGEVISDNSSLQLELDNGQWTFWAVAWDGNGSSVAFGGLTRCAKTGANLNGTDVQLGLTLANENCADPDFSPKVELNAGAVSFPKIKHYECSGITDHQGFSCKGNSQSYTKSTSKRLLMIGFRKSNGGAFQPRGGGIASSCVVSGATFVNERLPIGNGSIPAFTILQSFFSSSSCDETDPKGFNKDHFEFGLLGTNKATSKAYVATGTCSGMSAFTQTTCTKIGGSFSAGCSISPSVGYELEESFCSNNGGSFVDTPGSRNFELITTIPDGILCSEQRVGPSNVTPHKFSSGNGSIASPYTICTETQLNSIDGDGTLLSMNYSLNADLDMNRTSVFGDQSPPTCLSKDAGRNFNPIGGLYNNVCESMEAEVFHGSFNGSGHSISNIRLHEEDAEYLGFIRKGGTVSNLVLNNIEVEGKLKTAAVVGGMPLNISNVSVQGGKIKGSNYVGVITGYTDLASMPNLRVSDMHVRVKSNGAWAGGLIGGSTGSLTLSKSSFEGLIELENESMHVGGLVGDASSLVINESYTNGAILVSNSSVVGGLVGFGPNTTINSSYSKMTMGPANHYTGSGSNVGGIIGSHSALVMASSFYAGSMTFPCRNLTIQDCAVSSLSGGAALNGTNITNGTLGSFLNPTWYDGTYLTTINNTGLSAFQSNVKTNMFNNSSSFVDVGDVLPRLNWESGVCSKEINNRSVALQSVFRGTSDNPIVICNRGQFLDIKNRPGLNYVLEDHIGIGELPGDPAERIADFTGSIYGKNHILGGFTVSYDAGELGLIQRNNGTLSNIIFTTSSINAEGAGNIAGLVATNGARGVIENNKFYSVNILKGEFSAQGIVSGVNRGKIFNNKVSGKMNAKKMAGFLAGTNEGAGIITGSKVDGEMILAYNSSASYFGGAVGLNDGKISEVAVGVTINNSTHTAGSYVGSFVGQQNSGLIEDILVTPYAQMNITAAGPVYGQVFGTVTSSSTVKRVVAANEIAIPHNLSANVSSFTYNGSGADYSNSYFMTDSVFSYKSDVTALISGCANNTNDVLYYFSGSLAAPGGFGYMMYFKNVGSDYLSKRVTGSVASVSITSLKASHFFVPCEVGGVASGVSAYYTAPKSNFSLSAEVHSVTQAQMTNFLTYCPSRNSFTDLVNSTCSSGEFDITESYIGGFGFNRLKNAYKKLEVDGVVSDTRPVWTFDSDGDAYPQLFLAD